MPFGLDRRYGCGGLHFITFSCFRRLPLLESPHAKDIFANILGVMRERHEFALVGYVVMPEHVHFLMKEGVKGNPSYVIKALKQCVSRDLRKPTIGPGGRSLAFTKRGEELPRFWQPRFYDFNVYTNEKKKEKLLYMHGNPVRRGLVRHPGMWRWSSYWFYERGEHGLVKIDPVE